MKNKITNFSHCCAFTTYFSAASLLAVLVFHINPSQHGVRALSPVMVSGVARKTSCDLWSLKDNYFCGENNRSIRLYSLSGEMESEEKDNIPQVLYPALSPEEISNWLSSVEVYALMTTDGENNSDERIHLLYGPDGSAVTYFFISSEAADTMASQLKEIGGGDLSTTSLSLGKVWFGLLDPQGADRVEGVDYRLVPDPRDLNGAKVLLTESTDSGSSCSFLSPFNEIPTFLDVRMRIPGSEVVDDKPVEQLPVYLGLQNIIQASENMKASEDSLSTSSSAAINVADLNDLVKQMQQESTIDFRQSVLVPPTNM